MLHATCLTIDTDIDPDPDDRHILKSRLRPETITLAIVPLYLIQEILMSATSELVHAAFFDLILSILNDIVSTKIYDKRDDFNFDIVNFPFRDGDDPQRPSYGVYISQLIRFARAFSHVTDFNNRNKFLTAKLLKQGYRYHKLRKAFSKFYRRHFELIEKYHALRIPTHIEKKIKRFIFS